MHVIHCLNWFENIISEDFISTLSGSLSSKRVYHLKGHFRADNFSELKSPPGGGDFPAVYHQPHFVVFLKKKIEKFPK